MLRFAPSPTGDMHIGNLHVAILNYLVAQQRDEPFIIRIEDTDKEHNIEGKDTEIMQILEKFALKHESVVRLKAATLWFLEEAVKRDFI